MGSVVLRAVLLQRLVELQPVLKPALYWGPLVAHSVPPREHRLVAWREQSPARLREVLWEQPQGPWPDELSMSTCSIISSASTAATHSMRRRPLPNKSFKPTPLRGAA